jgi:hypothetical protein
VLADDRFIDEPPAAGAWPAFLEQAAYAAGFRRHWQDKPDDALAAYACSRESGRGAADRAAWLAAAYRLAHEALQDKPSLPRHLSFARIAADLGHRMDAVRALSAALDALDSEGKAPITTPFLAPSARYEALPAADSAEWLACAVRDCHERLKQRSSAFRPEATLATLEPIAHLTLRSPESERRRQLARMFRGLQRGFEPSPLLRERSEENLNPDIWSGAAGVVLGTSPESGAP